MSFIEDMAGRNMRDEKLLNEIEKDLSGIGDVLERLNGQPDPDLEIDSTGMVAAFTVECQNKADQLRHRATMLRQRADEMDRMADNISGPILETTAKVIKTTADTLKSIDDTLKKHAHIEPTKI